METGIGSMGSEYRRFRIDPAALPLFEEFDWNSLARRVFVNPVTGFVALMSPSSKHEEYAWATNDLAKALGRKFGFTVIAEGATRWRLPEDPQNTGVEPDACYYLGEKAERCNLAFENGEDARADFVRRTPPDLVVEIERSRGDGDKPGFYRRVGVTEMWRIDIRENRREVEMLDLQAPGGIEALPTSAALPLCTPDFVLEALSLARRGRLDDLDALVERAATREPEL